jgi:transcriptional regulator with PAS, ATPase and Fis domain
VRLLRVLQDKVYEPLGATTSEKANVRIVSATNKNLERMVKKGLFRDDLYYRINVVKLVLPPLRNRKEDIPLLIEKFVNKYSKLCGKEIHGLSPEAISTLMSYNFPGNIRELENIIEYATVVCKNSLIRIKNLPEHLLRVSDTNNNTVTGEISEKVITLETIEKDIILKTLRENNWNRKATAAQMGIHPSTLWRKIKRLNLKTPKQDGRSKNK